MNDLIYNSSEGAGRIIRTESGEEFLYFGGTSYLGLSQNIDFQKLVANGIQRYGLNYGSSRISNLRLKIYEEAEDFLAEKIGTEKVLTFSSGYMAGQAVTQWLKKMHPKTSIFYAPDTHPAVQNFDNQINNSAFDFKKWCTEIILKINKSKETEFILVMDSVDSLRGQTRVFDFLKQIKVSKKIILVVDDSHGIGVLGRVGEGVTNSLPDLPNLLKITVGSLGKACGVPAGFVASQMEVISELSGLSIFRGASPALPCFLDAFVNAETLRLRELEVLRERILFFSQQINPELFLFSASYPVFFAKNPALAHRLAPKKIALWHFAYSSVLDGKFSRIVLNSLHTKKDLIILINKINTTISL